MNAVEGYQYSLGEISDEFSLISDVLDPVPQVVRSITITESRVPSEYGHVTAPGHSQIYFEEMMKIMEAKGLGYKELLENGVHASVKAQETVFSRELKVGDVVTITTNIEELDKQIKFIHASNRGVKLTTEHIWIIDLRNKRGVPIEIPFWVSKRLRQEIDQPDLDKIALSFYSSQ